MKKAAIVVAAVMSLAACGGGSSSPTSSGPVYPNVAGNYSGTTTMSFPELVMQITCPTTTTITGSGANIAAAPLILGGQCGNMSIPLGAATIDTNGQLESVSGTFTDPSCGTYQYTASGGFFGRELRMSINATSRTCWNINMTFLLSR